MPMPVAHGDRPMTHRSLFDQVCSMILSERDIKSGIKYNMTPIERFFKHHTLISEEEKSFLRDVTARQRNYVAEHNRDTILQLINDHEWLPLLPWEMVKYARKDQILAYYRDRYRTTNKMITMLTTEKLEKIEEERTIQSEYHSQTSSIRRELLRNERCKRNLPFWPSNVPNCADLYSSEKVYDLEQRKIYYLKHRVKTWDHFYKELKPFDDLSPGEQAPYRQQSEEMVNEMVATLRRLILEKSWFALSDHAVESLGSDQDVDQHRTYWDEWYDETVIRLEGDQPVDNPNPASDLPASYVMKNIKKQRLNLIYAEKRKIAEELQIAKKPNAKNYKKPFSVERWNGWTVDKYDNIEDIIVKALETENWFALTGPEAEVLGSVAQTYHHGNAWKAWAAEAERKLHLDATQKQTEKIKNPKIRKKKLRRKISQKERKPKLRFVNVTLF